MELRDLIKKWLERIQQNTDRAAGDLTPAELKWQPNPEGNPVGFLLYHLARTEDRFVQANIRQTSPIWVSERWYEKLNIPASDTGGFGYTAEQIAAFNVPPLQDLQAYARAARALSLDVLKEMTDADADRIIKVGGPFGDVPLGTLWSIILGHNTQHTGEIMYLRGLLRGINK